MNKQISVNIVRRGKPHKHVVMLSPETTSRALLKQMHLPRGYELLSGKRRGTVPDEVDLHELLDNGDVLYAAKPGKPIQTVMGF